MIVLFLLTSGTLSCTTWNRQQLSFPLGDISIDLTNVGADVVVEVSLFDFGGDFSIGAQGPDDFKPEITTEGLSWSVTANSAMAMPAPTDRVKPIAPSSIVPSVGPSNGPATDSANIKTLSACAITAAVMANGHTFVGAAASWACLASVTRATCVATLRFEVPVASYHRLKFSGYGHLKVFACVHIGFNKERDANDVFEWPPKAGMCLPTYGYELVNLDAVCEGLPEMVVVEQDMTGDLLFNGDTMTKVGETPQIGVLGPSFSFLGASSTTFTLSDQAGEFVKYGEMRGDVRHLVENQGCRAIYDCVSGMCMGLDTIRDICVATEEVDAIMSTPAPVGPGAMMEECTKECSGCPDLVLSCTKAGAKCKDPRGEIRFCTTSWGNDCMLRRCSSFVSGKAKIMESSPCGDGQDCRFFESCTCETPAGCDRGTANTASSIFALSLAVPSIALCSSVI